MGRFQGFIVAPFRCVPPRRVTYGVTSLAPILLLTDTGVETVVVAKSWLVVVTLCLVLVGASAASAGGPDTKHMVLTLSDLPAGFSVTKAYYDDNKRAAKEGSTPLSSFVTWGRVTGYEADFEKGG